MTEPVGMSAIDQTLLRLTFLKYVGDAVRAANESARATAAALMKKGDTLAVRSPIDDTKMARVSFSDPKPVARVTDPVALDQWLRDNHGDKMKLEEKIVGTDTDIIPVLRQHAPRLLATKKAIPGWVIQQVVVMSQAAGEPVGPEGECGEQAPPGIVVTIPDGVLSVTADKTNGKAAFEQLWNAGMFGLDGTVVRLNPGESS